MKLNNNTNGYSTNVESESHEFSIGDPSVVIEILRNRLYSNPIQTLVQEYICNARDACRESNLPERVVIYMPTPNNKVFKVRDYGVGISPDRIANVFVKYASSTKRTDNKQTGGFGIGAKSAWAYTDNFTVVTYVDGTARHYVAHLGKSNTGSLDLMHTVATSEANGTEIQIGVAEKDLDAFHNAVYRSTFFWTIRPEIRGISPSDMPAWYRYPMPVKSIENVTFYKRDSLPPSVKNYNYVLSIDGIPYPVTDKFADIYCTFGGKISEHAAVINIATGIVDVSASREALSDGNTNQERLTVLFNNLEKSISDYCLKEFTNCASLGEFLKLYGELDKYYDIGDVTYGEYSLKHGELEIYHIDNQCYRLENTRDGSAIRLNFQSNNVWNRLWNYKLVYDDKPTDTPKPILSSKLRKHLLPFGVNTSVIVLNSADKASLKTFSEALGAVPLSSIELDKKLPGVKDDKNEIVITVYNERPNYNRAGTSTKTIDLDTMDLTRQYVYEVKEPTDQFTHQKCNRGEFATFVQEFTDKTYCFVAASNVKHIKDHANFVAWEEVVAYPLNYVGDDKKKKFFIHLIAISIPECSKHVRELAAWPGFMKRINEVDDKAFATITTTTFESLHSYNRSSFVERVINEYRRTNPSVETTIAAYKDMYSSFEKYLFLDKMVPSSYDDNYTSKEYIGEVILYLNARYKQG